MTRVAIDGDEPARPRPRVADIVPRLQLRGAEIFAQHLEVALADRYDCTLLPSWRTEDDRRATIGDAAPVQVRTSAASPAPVGSSPATRSAAWVRAARSLRARVAALSPDLVVAHGGDPLRLALIAGVHRRAALVYVRVAAVTPDLRTPARSHWLRAAYRRVDASVAVSGSLAEELIEGFGVDPRTVRVIGNGRLRPAALAPERLAELRRALGAAPDDVLTIWVGRMVPEKDPVAAIRLAERLAERAPSAHVAIVGDGPLAPEVRAAAEGAINLTLVGERDDAPSLIAAADLLVSTSRTEGAPGVFVEALMAGVPVVAHDMGGVRDVISDATGALVAAGDEDALADAVARLTNDPVARSDAAAIAREAGARSHIAPIAEAYHELYRELLARRATRP